MDEIGRKLTKIEVFGLLDHFDHSVEFSGDDDFVCIHGPNGVGKTRLLELVNAALSGRGGALYETPFQRLVLSFADRSSLTVEQARADGETVSLTWQVVTDSVAVSTFPADPGAVRESVRWLSKEGFIRTRVGAYGRRITDSDSGEDLTEQEAVDRYGHILPAGVAPIAPEVRQFTDGIRTRLIEVGRLRDVVMPSRGGGVGGRSEIERVTAIARCASDLADSIRAVQVRYSVEAQRVDRSYPDRLIRASSGAEVPTDGDIRELYASVVGKQDGLAELKLLAQQDGVFELPAGELESWQRRAVGMHLADSLQKLRAFDNISSRMRLFESIVNAKLEHKQLALDSDAGFRVVSDFGVRSTIEPDQLSSGEQHLIVMTYRLLFETAFGELVLIDEPEISLHVAWQRQFLDDLSEIAKIQGLRFIVATHSPQIVGRWTSRLVSIGSVD